MGSGGYGGYGSGGPVTGYATGGSYMGSGSMMGPGGMMGGAGMMGAGMGTQPAEFEVSNVSRTLRTEIVQVPTPPQRRP
ncbi:MAG TPA: hypothetical protein DCZ72_13000 [Armatimonadetes bacterium]|nr:hypothetical protein [Armatimonadota bacterium]